MLYPYFSFVSTMQMYETLIHDDSSNISVNSYLIVNMNVNLSKFKVIF